MQHCGTLNYSPPPMRLGIFCLMSKAVLEEMGWSFFDDLDGDISAPAALPLGGVMADGMFGPHTSFVPREWEAYANALRSQLESVQKQCQPTR